MELNEVYEKELDYEIIDDSMKDFWVGCVSDNSKKIYQSANITFLL